MVSFVGWIHLGTIAGAVVGTVLLFRWIWTVRDRPGANWFIGVFIVQFILLTSYAIGYLTFDPTIRYIVEVIAWVSAVWIATLYLAFALGYTGRVQYLSLRWSWPVVVIAVGMTVLTATDPVHNLLLSEFTVVSATGLSGVLFERGPLLYGIFFYAASLITIGTLFLLDTIISYGPLYRREAIAVGLSAVPPSIGYLLWTFDFGPTPALNLTPALFLPHVIFDTYAFVQSDMFDFHPATRRAGERAAIDDLGNPVVIVDQDGRVVTLNEAAEDLLQTEKGHILSHHIGEYYTGETIDQTQPEQTVAVRIAGRRHEFAVTSKPLYASGESIVGYTLVLQDVTEERQRKQRLEVLNRILRHNLRNDLNVIVGMADLLTDGQSKTRYSETIDRKAKELIELGEKAQAAADALGSTSAPTEIYIENLLAETAANVTRSEPTWTVDIRVPNELCIEANEQLLSLVFENLVENGLVHDPGTNPTVIVTVAGLDRTDGTVTLSIADTGPGIPAHEIQAIENETETALEHGSRLGLWAIKWGVTMLGGDISFDSTQTGTTVTLRLPGVTAFPTDNEAATQQSV
ncbi:histidine kinase N-terminal 7TM domain-containing protein [Natronocalculus amylovorans]|uniref:histidine kinase n=1 Tax=Natronocalculus amylovorans TaxID=2917812 RepID=A0AAE3FWK6_9EURY|nr:histidine kinase N-terminal 7TM domain-containing protein [Natronocalculus amylovorans]MCL9816260.1 ATP-binding protein [Natronocalculus amylovorans]